jgi:hypothetical protein
VLILKVVKVLCFDTLLQVLILNGFTGVEFCIAGPVCEELWIESRGRLSAYKSKGREERDSRGLRQTGWGGNFMSYGRAKLGNCQEKYIVGELLDRTNWEVVGGARVTVSSIASMRRIRVGVSYRARRELGVNFAIWQVGFTDHRIQDWQDYEQHCSYIHQNPVKARLVEAPELFAYSSAFPGVEVDPAPPWLKPVPGRALYRGA